MIKSIFYQLCMVLVALVGWLISNNFDKIVSYLDVSKYFNKTVNKVTGADKKPTIAYKWVDEDGQVHYGSEQPKGVDATKKEIYIDPEIAKKQKEKKKAKTEDVSMNPLDVYSNVPKLIEDAKQVQKTMNERNAMMEKTFGDAKTEDP